MARFCQSCGASLQSISTVPPPVLGSLAPIPPENAFKGFMGQYYATEQAKAIQRTKTGLLIISISFFVSWVPVLGYIAIVFQVAGALPVILGRKAFGQTHVRNVTWSIIISTLTLISAFIFGVAIFLSALSNPQYNPSLGPPSLTSNMVLFSVDVITATAIFGIAEVLLTYALQLKTGRILLWCGYVSAVAATSVSYLLLSQLTYLNMLPQLAPGLLFGYAYYLARARIVQGGVPQPVQSR